MLGLTEFGNINESNGDFFVFIKLAKMIIVDKQNTLRLEFSMYVLGV